MSRNAPTEAIVPTVLQEFRFTPEPLPVLPATRFSDGAPLTDLRPAPRLGEHNDAVLRDLLGMSDDDIAELAVAGVLE